jgi:hypothetical protein
MAKIKESIWLQAAPEQVWSLVFDMQSALIYD